VRLRLIAPVLLVLAVTAGGFLAALLLPERDARGEARHRADIAATEVRGGVEQGANLVESLRRFMLGQVDGGITNAQFEDVGARWLSPVGLPAAAWVEQLQKPRAGRVSLRATLATGAAPMTAPGIDLGGEAVLAAAVVDPRTLFRVTATPFARVRDGRTGIFLVQSAPRLSGGVLRPGFVVLFLPGSWLLAQVTEETNPRLRLRIGDTSYGGLGNATAVGSTFSAAGRRFDVLGPQEPVRGAAAVLPWLVLGGGLVLAALAGTLAAIAERRARAQRDVDRIFTLSPDLITVAGFDGFWKRVNPAFETRLGYTEREALARPSLEFVHPDDRERSEAAAIRLGEGETILAFENRLVCKDGSYRWIEWTATPVLDEGVFYSAGRDVTERRQAESEAARLGQEQAALRRVATLVAEGAPEAKLYDCVAREVAQVLGVPMVTIDRFDSDASSTVVASVDDPGFPVGSRWPLDGPSLGATVLVTARPARVDDYAQLQSTSAAAMRTWAVKSAAGVPILVDGRVWGVI